MIDYTLASVVRLGNTIQEVRHSNHDDLGFTLAPPIHQPPTILAAASKILKKPNPMREKKPKEEGKDKKKKKTTGRKKRVSGKKPRCACDDLSVLVFSRVLRTQYTTQSEPYRPIQPLNAWEASSYTPGPCTYLAIPRLVVA